MIEHLDRMRDEYPRIYSAQSRSAIDFLKLLERRTGILVEAGNVRYRGELVPVYEFRHLTFQEYLAALALVHGRFPDRDRSIPLSEHIKPLAGQSGAPAEFWREALRLCVACSGDDEVDGLLSSIVTPVDEYESASRALLATLCLADEPNVSLAVAQDVLTAFVKHVPPISARITREEIREIANCRWGSRLRSLFFEYYVTGSNDDRQRLTDLYSRLLGAQSLVTVEDRLSGVASADVSVVAESFLSLLYTAKMGLLTVEADFVQNALSAAARNPALTHCVIGTLFYVKTRSSRNNQWRVSEAELNALTQYLSHPSADVELARYIIPLLGIEGYGAASAEIVRWLTSPDERVRVLAVETLSKLSALAGLQQLSPLLRDSSPLVRVAAVKGLAGTTDEEAVNKVLEIAGGDPDYDTRIAAVRSLQKANQRQVADSLLDWLVRATGRVGVAIVDTLAEIGDPRVISVLIEKGLAGKKMKRAAIAAAARLKTQDAISLLEILAADPNAKVAQTAQRYLPQDGSCGSEKQAESLLRSRNEVPNSNVEHPTRAE